MRRLSVKLLVPLLVSLSVRLSVRPSVQLWVRLGTTCLLSLAAVAVGFSAGGPFISRVAASEDLPRVALLIANTASVRASDDPVIVGNRALAEALRGAGYTVQVAEDTTDKDLELALFTFIDTVPENALAIVGFAGQVGIVDGLLVPFPVGMSPLGLPPSNHLNGLMARLAAREIAGALWLIDANFRTNVGSGALKITVPAKTIVAFSTLLQLELPSERHFGETLAREIHAGAPGLLELLAQTRACVLEQSGGQQVPWELYNSSADTWSGAFGSQ